MTTKKTTTGLGINDLPMWAYVRFKKVAMELFKDDYSLRLIDLLNKERAYETLCKAIDEKGEKDGN